MSLKIFTGAQKSPEWFAVKLGKFSGSEISDLCGAKGLGQTGQSYIYKKVAETLTGSARSTFENEAMKHGVYYEPIVRTAYNKLSGIEFSEVGFIENEKFQNCGVSPDGINFELNTGIEIKCPFEDKHHLKHLRIKNQADLKKICPDYYWQIMLCMLITELENWKFISFSPYFLAKKDLRLWVVDIQKDQEEFDFLADRIRQANEIYNEILNELL
jgi:putative phage-type endonuclease